MCIYISLSICIYIHIYTYTYVCTYTYVIETSRHDAHDPLREARAVSAGGADDEGGGCVVSRFVCRHSLNWGFANTGFRNRGNVPWARAKTCD